MKGIRVTYEIAHAAGWDAGNRHAAAHGRTAWNEDDWNAAAEVMNRLLGPEPAESEKSDLQTDRK